MLVGSQAASSLSNFLVTAAVIRSGEATAIADVAVALAVYAFVLSAGRSLLTQRALQKGSDRHTVAMRIPAAHLILGLCALLPALLTVLLVGAGRIAFILGLGLPILLTHEGLRGQALLAGRTSTVLALDLGWLLAQGSLMACWAFVGTIAPDVAVLTWVGGALFSCIAVFAKVRPPAEMRRLSLPGAVAPYLADLGLGVGTLQVTNILALPVIGVAALAEVRIALLVFVPLSVLGQALPLLIQRLVSQELVTLRRLLRLLPFGVAALGGATVLVGFFFSLGPRDLTQVLLGAAPAPSLALTVVTSATVICELVFVALAAAMRALGTIHRLVRIRLFTAPLYLLGSLFLGYVGGPIGFMAGVLLATVVSAACLIASAYRLAND